MKCPYNRKSEIQIQAWKQSADENQYPEVGETVTRTVFELMNCEKDRCGAWHNGKCCYSAVRISNS